MAWHQGTGELIDQSLKQASPLQPDSNKHVYYAELRTFKRGPTALGSWDYWHRSCRGEMSTKNFKSGILIRANHQQVDEC